MKVKRFFTYRRDGGSGYSCLSKVGGINNLRPNIFFPLKRYRGDEGPTGK